MKATITKPDGSIIVVEGSADDVAKIINPPKHEQFTPVVPFLYPAIPLQPNKGWEISWTLCDDSSGVLAK